MAQKITVEELLKLQKKIENGKQEVAKKQGEIESLYKQMKEKYGCSTLEQADKKLAEMEKDEQQLQKKIDTQVETLRTEYPQLFE